MAVYTASVVVRAFVKAIRLGFIRANRSITASTSRGMSLWSKRRIRSLSRCWPMVLRSLVLMLPRAELLRSTVAVVTGASSRMVRTLWMLGKERVFASSKAPLMLDGRLTLASAWISHFFRHLFNSSWKVLGSGRSAANLLRISASFSSFKLFKFPGSSRSPWTAADDSSEKRLSNSVMRWSRKGRKAVLQLLMIVLVGYCVFPVRERLRDQYTRIPCTSMGSLRRKEHARQAKDPAFSLGQGGKLNVFKPIVFAVPRVDSARSLWVLVLLRRQRNFSPPYSISDEISDRRIHCANCLPNDVSDVQSVETGACRTFRGRRIPSCRSILGISSWVCIHQPFVVRSSAAKVDRLFFIAPIWSGASCLGRKSVKQGQLLLSLHSQITWQVGITVTLYHLPVKCFQNRILLKILNRK